jgi:hypothetical protein
MYEVQRSEDRLDQPLLCLRDQTPCELALAIPTFEVASTPWSHFGHSHAPGQADHEHGPGGFES